MVCAALAWLCLGIAIRRMFGGRLGTTALATGIVYTIAGCAVFAGAFIIFLMTIIAAPLALGLLLRRQSADRNLPAAATRLSPSPSRPALP